MYHAQKANDYRCIENVLVNIKLSRLTDLSATFHVLSSYRALNLSNDNSGVLLICCCQVKGKHLILPA